MGRGRVCFLPQVEPEEDGEFEADLDHTVRPSQKGRCDGHATYLCGRLPEPCSLSLPPLDRINWRSCLEGLAVSTSALSRPREDGACKVGESPQ